MPGTTTQFKLGLFALAAVIALAATAVGFGVRGARSEAIRYQTYFDESAQGLELGAPVKYRGVKIGNVGDISIAPDRRQVGVGLAIDRSAAVRLDLEQRSPALRTQIAMQGITGVKFIDMDFVSPESNPPMPLPFPPGARYIPSRPSLFKGLEGRLGGVVRDIPDLIERATIAIDKLGRVLDDVREQKLAERAASFIDHIDATNEQLQRWVDNLTAARLPTRAATSLDKFDALTTKLTRTVDELEGAGELVASAKRATDNFGDVGRTARASSRELERTLRDVGDAARALREFIDALDREPDMLVKGKARTR
jgi:phospholipid/cholesterol/gamma-HCH transport system substrate-binding protein